MGGRTGAAGEEVLAGNEEDVARGERAGALLDRGDVVGGPVPGAAHGRAASERRDCIESVLILGETANVAGNKSKSKEIIVKMAKNDTKLSKFELK